MTLDGFCNHEAGIADEEIHEHYNEVLRSGDTLIYGRTTYQLMESYWPGVVKNPTGNKPADDFAVLIDNIQKIVYSRTLKSVTWRNSILKHEINKEEILALKQQAGKNIFVGSPGMIVQMLEPGVVDELHINVLPTVLGKGCPYLKTSQNE